MGECTEIIGHLRGEIRSAFDRETANSNYVTAISTTRTRHDETDIVPNLVNYPFDQFIDFVNAIIRVHPANPSRKDSIDRSDASYSVDAPRAQLEKDAAPIDTFQEISNHLETLLHKTEHLAVIGARGIGKTSLINHWLNHRSSYLEEELKYIWFRVDMSKVYWLKRDKSVSDTIAKIDKYYVVHAMYVVLFYAEHLSVVPTSTNQVFSDAIKEAIERHGDEFDFRQFVTDFADLCEQTYNLHGTQNLSENTVNEIFAPKNRHLFESAFVAWNIISKIFAEKGYGIISIIDGIDNIAWNKNNKHYKDACDEAAGFVIDCRKINRNRKTKLLIVARPETIPEISHGTIYYGYNTGYQMTPEGIKFSVIRLHVPFTEKIVNKKTSAIRDETAFVAQRDLAKRAFVEHAVIDKRSARFEDAVSGAVQCFDSFLGSLSLQISKVLATAERHSKTKFQHDVSPTGVIETVFDNDIRAMLDCVIRAFRSRGAAEQIRVRGFDFDGRMLEYVVLGGRFFLDSRPYERKTRSNQIKRGDVFSNIFWFDQAEAAATQSVWHGLAGFRLLKLLKERPLPAQDALSFIHSCFNYNPRVLLTHLEDFIAFGLIDVDIFSKADPSFKSSHPIFADLTSFVQTSKKGRFMLDFTLAYTDWLYFLALDTPLHRLAVENSMKVRFYRDPKSLEVAFNYFDAFVPTLATFLKHLYWYDKRDLVYLDDRRKVIEESYSGLVGDWSILRSWFELPEWFIPHCLSEIQVALNQRRRNARPNETYSYPTLVRDLIGTFGNRPASVK
jgi:hypothetical protein